MPRSFEWFLPFNFLTKIFYAFIIIIIISGGGGVLGKNSLLQYRVCPCYWTVSKLYTIIMFVTVDL
jgi:hypothetical protein